MTGREVFLSGCVSHALAGRAPSPRRRPSLLLLTVWCSRDDFRDVVISVPPGVELISQGIDDTSASSPDDSGTTLYRLRRRVGERSMYAKRDGKFENFTIVVTEEREIQRFEWREAESRSH